jgi:hypothetical protein
MASKNASRVTIIPLPDKKSIQSIRFDFFCATRSEPISIELPARLAKGLGDGILEVLGAGNTPSPATRARVGGKPKLRIVK